MGRRARGYLKFQSFISSRGGISHSLSVLFPSNRDAYHIQYRLRGVASSQVRGRECWQWWWARYESVTAA